MVRRGESGMARLGLVSQVWSVRVGNGQAGRDSAKVRRLGKDWSGQSSLGLAGQDGPGVASWGMAGLARRAAEWSGRDWHGIAGTERNDEAPRGRDRQRRSGRDRRGWLRSVPERNGTAGTVLVQ